MKVLSILVTMYRAFAFSKEGSERPSCLKIQGTQSVNVGTKNSEDRVNVGDCRLFRPKKGSEGDGENKQKTKLGK